LRKKRGVVLQATWDAANQMDDYTGPHNQRNGVDNGFHLLPCRFLLKNDDHFAKTGSGQI
jgi:hypothetical protein